mmetsp:Transcript_59593/g.192899  ORF Transcript_59593/g.192899 Transcript_59593/m.192899 type:complete len:254 (+) Transcript_59593:900-1661(+)
MAAWLEALDAHFISSVPKAAGEDPAGHWQICTTYTCGLWTLFHVVLVGATDEHRGGPLVGEALPRIRGFVSHFFGCKECVQHWLHMYDSCQLGRCDLAPEDGRGAALWLWQVHNNVTLRVAAEQQRPIPEPWPSRSLCPGCWTGAADVQGLAASVQGLPWDASVVFDYLVRSYLPSGTTQFEIQEFGMDMLDKAQRFGSPSAMFGVAVLVAALLAVGAVALNTWRSVPKVPYTSPQDRPVNMGKGSLELPSKH